MSSIKLIKKTFTFMESYLYNENGLCIFAQICARENLLPITLLGKFSLVSTELLRSVQWRINILKKLREKWQPTFAWNLWKYLINHPIMYTGKIVKKIPIGDMGYTPLGVRVISSNDLFSDEFLSNNRIAFTNLMLYSREKVPFTFTMFMGLNALLTLNIQSENYIDLNPTNEKNNDDGVINDHGRYLIDLSLPTQVNPVLLGEGFIDINRIYFCITTTVNITCNENDNIMLTEIFYVGCFIKYFTHAILTFNTVPNTAYRWSDYCLTFNGKINNHINRTSLIRSSTDEGLCEEIPPNVDFSLIELYVNEIYESDNDED